MKIALHTAIEGGTLAHLHLSDRTRKILIALVSTLTPYAVAAIGVFVYHKQFLMQ